MRYPLQALSENLLEEIHFIIKKSPEIPAIFYGLGQGKFKIKETSVQIKNATAAVPIHKLRLLSNSFVRYM